MNWLKLRRSEWDGFWLLDKVCLCLYTTLFLFELVSALTGNAGALVGLGVAVFAIWFGWWVSTRSAHYKEVSRGHHRR